jgi:hypothetical protein
VEGSMPVVTRSRSRQVISAQVHFSSTFSILRATGIFSLKTKTNAWV